MSQEDFIQDAGEQFCIVGPQISEAEIDAVFPEPFPGKDDLVQFYLHYNGGGRTEQCCVIHCGNPEHRASRNHLEKMKIEGFFSISSNPEERMLPFAPMRRCHATRLRIFAEYPAMKTFLEKHIPIAFDHSGDECWIDTQDGRIEYIPWDTWKEGPIEIASSFREFVLKFWNAGSGGCPIDPPSSS
jgi:hypothetical protein